MSRRCCCPEGCAVFSEDLANCEIDKVDDWDEVVGTWTVVDPDDPDCLGNQYLESSGSGSVLICKHPTTYTGQCVSITFDSIAGSKPRAILNYDYVSGEYLYVEFDLDADQVIFGRSDSGVIETFDCLVAGQELGHAWITRFNGCDGKVLLSAQTEGTENCQNCGWVCTTTPDGKYAGIGDGSGTSRFMGGETFGLDEHTDNYDECCHCDCLCGNNCVPWTLNYTITGDVDNPPCCDDPPVSTENSALIPVGVWGGNPPGAEKPCKWGDEFTISCAAGFGFSIDFYNNTTDRHPDIDDFLFDISDDTEGPSAPDGTSACCPFYAKTHFTLYIEIAEEPYFLTCGYTLEIYE